VDLLPTLPQKRNAICWVIILFCKLNNRDTNVTDTLEEKKPMTRLRYADTIKMVYNGREEQDTVGIRRFRYR